MKLRNLARSLAVGIAAVAGMSLAFATGVAGADKLVRAKQAVVISDDITKDMTDVIHAAGVSGGSVSPSDDSSTSGDDKSGNDKNRSGLVDGTNPGQGDGTSNSPNEGTDNPNNAGNSNKGKKK